MKKFYLEDAVGACYVACVYSDGFLIYDVANLQGAFDLDVSYLRDFDSAYDAANFANKDDDDVFPNIDFTECEFVFNMEV